MDRDAIVATLSSLHSAPLAPGGSLMGFALFMMLFLIGAGGPTLAVSGFLHIQAASRARFNSKSLVSTIRNACIVALPVLALTAWAEKTDFAAWVQVDSVFGHGETFASIDSSCRALADIESNNGHASFGDRDTPIVLAACGRRATTRMPGIPDER